MTDPVTRRRQLTVTVDITHSVWGNTLDDAASELSFFGQPAAAILAAHVYGEQVTATLTEYDDRTGDVTTLTLWAEGDET